MEFDLDYNMNKKIYTLSICTQEAEHLFIMTNKELVALYEQLKEDAYEAGASE